MATSIKLNPISFMALYVEAYFGTTRLAIATAFTWESGSKKFLVTNWHVITGKNPKDNQPLDLDGATPEMLRVWFHLAENIGRWEALDLPLFDKQSRPLWMEHAAHRSLVDVALLELNLPERLRLFPANAIRFDDFRSEVSQDVFIVGFPRGVSGMGKLPIWKRGSIASEPEVDLDKLPKLLIDSATRDGMSGSPVIGQYVGYYADDPAKPSLEDWIGSARMLLGVYSGRMLGKDEFEAQLGIVWKAKVIDEIATSGVRPT